MSRDEARAALLGLETRDEAEPQARRQLPVSRQEARQRLLEASETPADSLRQLVRWKPHWALLGSAAVGFVAARSPGVQTLLVRTLLDSIGVGKD